MPTLPDPHHLADHVGLGEAVEQVPPVLLEGEPVPGEQPVDQVRPARRRRSVTRSGGSVGDAGPAVRRLGQLGVGALVRSRFLRFFSMWTETRPRSAGSKYSRRLSTCMPSYQMSSSGMAA